MKVSPPVSAERTYTSQLIRVIALTKVSELTPPPLGSAPRPR